VFNLRFVIFEKKLVQAIAKYMLLVYTHKITPRVKYIFKQICIRIIGVPVSFTTKIEEFIAHDSLKMSYTRQPLSNEVFVSSHELLFAQGISDIEIDVKDWYKTRCFFSCGEKSAMPFDIFAASFYLLSRYEEYLPHVKDEFGRFTANESLAFKEGFLHEPVVDMWAYRFKAVLQVNYPKYKFEDKSYSIKPVIDVPCAYQYKSKGIMRSIGGTLKDLLRFKLKNVYERYSVLLGFKRDPFDTFKYIINRQKQAQSKFVVFFLVGNYSTYDKNINVQKRTFTSLIKRVGDYCSIGLKTSYFALDHFKTLKIEKLRMEAVINTALQASRHSFSKLNLPESYRNLITLEIKEDYTMGYPDHIGFRAGTSTPFFFYDLDYEIQTPLRIHSYPIMDNALLQKQSLLDKRQVLQNLINKVKDVDGEFVAVFHNYTFSNNPKWKGYKQLFNIILNSIND